MDNSKGLPLPQADPDFDGPSFSQRIVDAMWRGEIDAANAMVVAAVKKGQLGPDNYRVLNAQNLIRNTQDYLSQIARSAERDQSLSIIELDLDERAVGSGLPPKLSPSTPAARLQSYIPSFAVSRETINELDIPDEERAKFLSSGFGLHAKPGMENEQLWIEKDCRITAGTHDSQTVVAGNGTYIPSRSARIAKASRLNIVRKAVGSIPEALVLPFPHSPANYYHSLSEMVYALRHLPRVSESCPIVFGSDRFGVLPAVATALDIDRKRLVSADTLLDQVIDTAYLPGNGPFVWSSNFTRFFRSIAHRVPRPKSGGLGTRVYISRGHSSRRPEYEGELEAWLRGKGFETVHAEDLTVQEQIGLFADATHIVSHHGAGLANIAFSSDRVQLVEIFQESMLAPDFYQRSRFVTGNYTPIIGTADSVIDRVARAIA